MEWTHLLERHREKGGPILWPPGVVAQVAQRWQEIPTQGDPHHSGNSCTCAAALRGACLCLCMHAHTVGMPTYTYMKKHSHTHVHSYVCPLCVHTCVYMCTCNDHAPAHAQGCIQSHFGATMHYPVSVHMHVCGNTHMYTQQACLHVYTHAHTHPNTLVHSYRCVHTAGTPTHKCSYIYLRTHMPLLSMCTLIHAYSFVPHTLSPGP